MRKRIHRVKRAVQKTVWNKFRRPHFRPAESAFLVYQFFLLAAALLYSFGGSKSFIIPLSVMVSIGLTLFCRSFRPDHPFLRALCEWFYLYPVVFIGYFASCPLIDYFRPERYDSDLSAIDMRFFGVTPNWASNVLNYPWITEIFTWGYVSYYFFGLLLIVPIYIRYGSHSKPFHESFNAILLAFFFTYAGYWLIPASGPRVYWESQLPPLQVLYLSAHVFGPMDKVARGFPDAFPSEHTSLSLLMLWFLFKNDRQIFWLALPFAVCAVGATLVLRYHWCIDVTGGVAVAALVAWLSTWLASQPGATGD